MHDVEHLRLEWERRLPPLEMGWTHWRLEGDGTAFGFVPATQLATALRLIEDNFQRFSRIKAFRARADERGNCIEVENMFFLIDDRTKAYLVIDEK